MIARPRPTSASLRAGAQQAERLARWHEARAKELREQAATLKQIGDERIVEELEESLKP